MTKQDLITSLKNKRITLAKVSKDVYLSGFEKYRMFMPLEDEARRLLKDVKTSMKKEELEAINNRVREIINEGIIMGI